MWEKLKRLSWKELFLGSAGILFLCFVLGELGFWHVFFSLKNSVDQQAQRHQQDFEQAMKEMADKQDAWMDKMQQQTSQMIAQNQKEFAGIEKKYTMSDQELQQRINVFHQGKSSEELADEMVFWGEVSGCHDQIQANHMMKITPEVSAHCQKILAKADAIKKQRKQQHKTAQQ